MLGFTPISFFKLKLFPLSPTPTTPQPDLAVAVLEGLGRPDYIKQDIRGGRGHKLQSLTHTAAHDKVRRRKQQQNDTLTLTHFQ